MPIRYYFCSVFFYHSSFLWIYILWFGFIFKLLLFLGIILRTAYQENCWISCSITQFESPCIWSCKFFAGEELIHSVMCSVFTQFALESIFWWIDSWSQVMIYWGNWYETLFKFPAVPQSRHHLELCTPFFFDAWAMAARRRFHPRAFQEFSDVYPSLMAIICSKYPLWSLLYTCNTFSAQIWLK